MQRPGSPYLFAKADGSQFVDMKNGFVAAFKRAGLTDLGDTTCATHLHGSSKAGGDLYHLSRILGHATIEMTARYGHLRHLRTVDLHSELRWVAQNRT
jgi:integrase/recombinase XerD